MFKTFVTLLSGHASYVPCCVKYPRCCSIFRILSVELWFVLIISIVIVTISTTLVGRYSCTSEWQGYKTLTSSLTNVWVVNLWVTVSTMPRTPSPRMLSFAWVCFSLAFSTVFQAFLTTSPATKHQFKTWMSFSPQVLNFTTHQYTITFSRMVTKLDC